jgi:hypothetical protein
MFKLGDKFRKENNLTDEMCLKMEELKISEKVNTKMSKIDEEMAVKGDIGQGERMVKSKKK